MEKIGKNGVIIFDGSCGACSTVIGERKAFFEGRGFTVVPLQEKCIQELTRLEEPTLSEAIHLYTPDKKIFKGIDFVHQFSKKVWWLFPVSLLLNLKLGREIGALVYDWIAKRRAKISKACGLQSHAIYKSK